MSEGIDLGFISLIVGGAMIVFPEPGTTMAGVAIVAATFGLSALMD